MMTEMAEVGATLETGRGQRHPAGARLLVQRLYILLVDSPQGLTLSQIHDDLREGWLDTAAYRQYKSKCYQHGTPEFQERARRWYLRKSLGAMCHTGTARVQGEPRSRNKLYLVGSRPPRIMVNCEYNRRHTVPMDVDKLRAKENSVLDVMLRREKVLHGLLGGIDSPDIDKRCRELLQLAYDFIANR